MKKIVFVSFRGELACFQHVLLNVWDYHQRGYETALVMEGESTERLGDIVFSPKAKLWQQIKDTGLVTAVCKACAAQMGTLDEAERQGLPVDSSLFGHAALEPFTRNGWEIVVI